MTVDEIKLNIGAGNVVIDGYTPIDRKFGSEAFPLNYADNSVSDIRCSHMLEHLSFDDAQKALAEWTRVLKPGGRLRVAVPDFRKIADSIDSDPLWAHYAMGGQTDADDFHKSAYSELRLRGYLSHAGLVNIQPWHSPNTDTAAHPISLNLEAFKPLADAPAVTQTQFSVKAVMSVPRIGWNDAGAAIECAMRPLGITLEMFHGVFWGQCMQRAFERCVADGTDWILALDYDSMPRPSHLVRLLKVLGSSPHIDAIAPLQMRGGGEESPLLSQTGKKEVAFFREPFQVDTAHFGMTLIRTSALKDVAKPWFASQPDADGGWGEGRIDDDIWFWRQWKAAGKTVYVDPEVRIGHLQLLVSEFDDDMKPRHVPITNWWNAGRT